MRAAAIDAGAQVAVDYQAEDLKARVREVTGAADALNELAGRRVTGKLALLPSPR